MQLLKTINPEQATQDEISSYPTRRAARAVVADRDGNIALLHVTNKNYYKLPGGGIEEGEGIEEALKRECIEEIGCKIEIAGQVGEILEHRKMFSLNQHSYCYLARVVGEKGSPSFEKDEIEEGFEIVWTTPENALSLLSDNQALDMEGRDYIVPRDSSFLVEGIDNSLGNNF